MKSKKKLEKILVKKLSLKEDGFISFDVFDTLVMRAVSPDDVLRGLARYILLTMQIEVSDLNIEKVLHVRGVAWSEVLGRDPNLEDDSVEVMSPVWIDKLEKEFQNEGSGLTPMLLNEFESCLEISVMEPIPETLELCKKLVNDGHELIYVSDMYLTKATVERILEKCGYGGLFAHGFVSSEEKHLKRTGSLFPIVEKKIRKKIKIHIGDNKEADYLMPKKRGIESVHWVCPEVLNRRRSLTKENKAIFQNTLTAAFFMNSKLNSLSISNGYKRNLLGSSLANFSLMLTKHLSQSKRVGLFAAREGLILKELVEVSSPWYRISDLHYVPFSRKNVSPFLHVSSPLEYLQVVQRDAGSISWLTFADLIGMDHRTALDLSSAFGLVDSVNHINLSRDKEPLIRIFGSEIFQNFWIMRTKSTGKNIQNYLQSLPTYKNTGNRYCIVDLGWGGTIQANVAEALDKKDEILGLYFGLYGTAFNFDYAKSRYSYLVSSIDFDFTSHSAFVCPQLIELFTLAPHETYNSWNQVENEESINSWINNNPSMSTKLTQHMNALKMMKTLIYLHFVYWPTEESIAAYTRTAITKITLFPQREDAIDLGQLNSDYGFTKAKYALISKDSSNRLSNFRGSVWRYGAATYFFGGLLSKVLLLRDQKRWVLLSPPQRNAQNKVDARTEPLTSSESSKILQEIKYSEYLERNARGMVVENFIDGNFLLRLRLFIGFCNFYRILLRIPRFRNFSIPLRTFLLTRTLNDIK